jgi:2-oxoglutarate ferredoxin oxidoreductase subunit gamma
LINRSPERRDIDTVFIPANEVAESLGDKRLTNMVALGALLERLPVLPRQAIEQALNDHLPERHKRLLPVNYQALRQGAEFAAAEVVEAAL